MSDSPHPDPRSAASISAERVPGQIGPAWTPLADDVWAAPPPAPPRRALPRGFWKAPALTGGLVAVVLLASGQLPALAQALGVPLRPSAQGEAARRRLSEPPVAVPERVKAHDRETVERAAPGDLYYLRDHPLHPDNLFRPYTAGDLIDDPNSPRSALILDFRRFLDLFSVRQGQDDNFTIRFTDKRNGETLLIHELRAERAAHERTGSTVWENLDLTRRTETTRLLDSYFKDRGLTRNEVDVKWGRANQVEEAYERDLPFVQYEINLARRYGFSLLTTEIGTVETFNQDHLVSSAGARSRYQMMPDVLRGVGLKRYTLRTASGSRVDVREELHPLLAMEGAFAVMRGYTNAVGHELPGISSYHTGPGNIFAVYRMFAASHHRAYRADAPVLDAYLWGLTEGYPTVSSQTSFKTASRGYVASAYGALRANENRPIDRALAFTGEGVRLRLGSSIRLSTLLDVLDRDGLAWTGLGYRDGQGDPRSVYERFRKTNPHLQLPPSYDGGVPANGDVLLTATEGGSDVRFFLPAGASVALRRVGYDVMDERRTRRYDEHTFLTEEAIENRADREYADLVRRAEHLSGFTAFNRARLEDLYERFQRLAESDPSTFRLMQLNTIKTHRTIWRTNAFDRLVATLAYADGRGPMPPPEPSGAPTAPSETTGE